MFLVLLSLISSCNLPKGAQNPIEPSALDQRLTLAANLTLPTLIQTPSPPPSPTAGFSRVASPTPTLFSAIPGMHYYTSQQGDTLPALAARFGVETSAIHADRLLSPGLLPVGTQLQIPKVLQTTLPNPHLLLPDSEVIYSPTVGDFDVLDFVKSAGGFLAEYTEVLNGKPTTGAEIIRSVALETSTNPKLLLAFLEYRSSWIFSFPESAAHDPYPLGYGAGADTGLYKELMITAKLLAQGFYGWRDGTWLSLVFYGGESGRLAPDLNAGSVALQNLFAALYTQEIWDEQLFGSTSFIHFYQEMFDDDWDWDESNKPSLDDAIRQPELALPFAPGEIWSLTAGPHITWQTGTPRGALDFAPVTGEDFCAVSFRWVTAAAPGLVVRNERSVVALDLDGDGDEGTGWVLIYLHIAPQGSAAVGTYLGQDDRLGHPSCEGGQSTGTHVHFARKFNGEWIAAAGPLPLILSGWQAYPGETKFQGYLKKEGEIINAQPNGAAGSTIIREP